MTIVSEFRWYFGSRCNLSIDLLPRGTREHFDDGQTDARRNFHPTSNKMQEPRTQTDQPHITSLACSPLWKRERCSPQTCFCGSLSLLIESSKGRKGKSQEDEDDTRNIACCVDEQPFQFFRLLAHTSSSFLCRNISSNRWQGRFVDVIKYNLRKLSVLLHLLLLPLS